MFTGRFPHELTADFLVPLDDTYPTLAEVLASNGYDTAGFAANYHYVTYKQGLDLGFLRQIRMGPGCADMREGVHTEDMR